MTRTGRHVIALFERHLDKFVPFLVRDEALLAVDYATISSNPEIGNHKPLTLSLDAFERELASSRQLAQPPQRALQEPRNLHGGTVAWRARQAFVPCALRFAHLVHPRPTVEPIPTQDQARLPVDPDIDVEPLVAHLYVQVRARVVLTERDPARVALQDLLHDLRDRARVRVRARVVPRHPDITAREAAPDGLAEYGQPVRCARRVVLDILEHPPGRVARVVPRVAQGVEEVRDEAVLEHRHEREDVCARTLEVACREEEAAERDEHVPAPTTRPSCSEVGKTGGHRWCRLPWIERGGLDLTVHLDGT